MPMCDSSPIMVPLMPSIIWLVHLGHIPVLVVVRIPVLTVRFGHRRARVLARLIGTGSRDANNNPSSGNSPGSHC